MPAKQNILGDVAFGERLRFLREKAGLSQDALAQKLGYKRSSSVSNLETGKSPPDIQILQNIASCFNANLHWLITGKPSPDGESWRESYADLFRMYSADGGLWIDHLRAEIADRTKELNDLHEKESRGKTINHLHAEMLNEIIRDRQGKLSQVKDHLQRAVHRLGGGRIEY
jgi:transcriptional regulator with XRE-family HTH domain